MSTTQHESQLLNREEIQATVGFVVDPQFTAVTERFDGLDGRLYDAGQKYTQLEENIKKLKQSQIDRSKNVEARVLKIEEELKELKKWVKAIGGSMRIITRQQHELIQRGRRQELLIKNTRFLIYEVGIVIEDVISIMVKGAILGFYSTFFQFLSGSILYLGETVLYGDNYKYSGFNWSRLAAGVINGIVFMIILHCECLLSKILAPALSGVRVKLLCQDPARIRRFTAHRRPSTTPIDGNESSIDDEGEEMMDFTMENDANQFIESLRNWTWRVNFDIFFFVTGFKCLRGHMAISLTDLTILERGVV